MMFGAKAGRMGEKARYSWWVFVRVCIIGGLHSYIIIIHNFGGYQQARASTLYATQGLNIENPSLCKMIETKRSKPTNDVPTNLTTRAKPPNQ